MFLPFCFGQGRRQSSQELKADFKAERTGQNLKDKRQKLKKRREEKKEEEKRREEERRDAL